MSRVVHFLVIAIGALTSIACASVPAPIEEELSRTPRSATAIVFFTDFQCPYCRRTHAALEAVAAQRRGKLRIVYRHVPLPSHPNAHLAARAAICAEQLGTSGDYPAALFAQPSLSEAVCEELAEAGGTPPETFRLCLHDRATSARIQRDIAIFDAIHGDGVPIVYVGRVRLEGELSREDFEAALDAQ